MFIPFAGVLIAVALLLLLPPLFRGGPRHRPVATTAQASAALAVLREQLTELEAEHAAGRVNETTYTQTREELERRALEEGEADYTTPGNTARPARHWAAAITLFVPIAATAIYLILGNPDGLDPQKTAVQGEPDAAQIAGMVDKLVKKLEQEPDNVEGWIMLVRSYRFLGEYAKANAAFTRLAALLPDNPDVLADWAETVAAQKGGVNGEAEALALKAIAIDPNHAKALTFAGAAAFERGDYAAASAYWERILAQIPPDEKEMAASVLAGINEARAKGGLPALALPKTDRPATATPAGSPLRIAGRITVSAELQNKISPEDTVFVFVRGNSGGPPLAALRFKASELPRDFSFADTPLMMGNSTIPAELTLAARISKTDKIAAAQRGDIEGSLENIAPDAQGVSLQINRIHD